MKSQNLKKIQRRWLSLLKLIYGLSGNADWFITLVYPQNNISTDDIVDRIKNDINKFSNRIRNNYKNSWFVYSIEYSPKSNIHVHLIGRLGRKKIKPNSKAKRKFERQVKKWWASIVNSKKSELSHIRYLKSTKMSDKRKGYLVKFIKRLHLKILIEKFGTQYTHGVINRKNLPKAKPIKFEFSEKDFNKYIRPALIKEANEIKSRKTSFHKSKLKTNDSGYHILSHPKEFEALLKKHGREV